MTTFTPSDHVRVKNTEGAAGFLKRYNTAGPFLVVGVHPKGNDGDQLVCLCLSDEPGDVVVVEGNILAPVD